MLIDHLQNLTLHWHIFAALRYLVQLVNLVLCLQITSFVFVLSGNSEQTKLSILSFQFYIINSIIKALIP